MFEADVAAHKEQRGDQDKSERLEACRPETHPVQARSSFGSGWVFLRLDRVGCPRRAHRRPRWHQGRSGEPRGCRCREAGEFRLRRGQPLPSAAGRRVGPLRHPAQGRAPVPAAAAAQEARRGGCGGRGWSRWPWGPEPSRGLGHRPGARRESQKERKSLLAPRSAARQPRRRPASHLPRNELPEEGSSKDGLTASAGVTLDGAERRPYRESRPYETERQVDCTAETFTDENQWTALIVRGLFQGVEAREGACEAEAGAVPETEPLMLSTRGKTRF